MPELTKEKDLALRRFAASIRIELLKELASLGFGHIGGSLSIVDLLAVLYGEVMRIDPKNPHWEKRDKLIVSKGHSGPAVYAALALKGYFPPDMLKTLNQGGTSLPSHCDRSKTPGIDATTGSLGQGASEAVGIALAERLGKTGCRTYLILGDGELQEGQCWEAIMFAASHRLEGLTVFVDNNKRQLDGYLEDIQTPFDLAEKFRSFGCHVLRADGHDVRAIHNAIREAEAFGNTVHVILLDPIKGKGIREVEETVANHSMTISPQQCNRWMTELEQALHSIGKETSV